MARHYILSQKKIIAFGLRHDIIRNKKKYLSYFCLSAIILYSIFCYSFNLAAEIWTHQTGINDMNPNLQISCHSGLS